MEALQRPLLEGDRQALGGGALLAPFKKRLDVVSRG